MKIYQEPFFLPANHNEFLAKNVSWIEDNQQFRQSQKYLFYRNAIDYIIENNVSGSYFEFGVHKARTFTMVMSLDAFYATHKGSIGNMIVKDSGGYFERYIAFDSFEGFPDGTNVNEHPLYKEGHVKTSKGDFLSLLKSYGQRLDRVDCVEGFYEQSLNNNLTKRLIQQEIVCSLVTIDCNLYNSYKLSLEFLEKFLRPGSVVYLDDYHSHRAQRDFGPKRAWLEYLDNSIWIFEDFLTVGWSGRSFVVCGMKSG